MTKKKLDLFAVDGKMVHQEAGVITFFRFSGDADETDVEESSDENGLDEKHRPKKPHPETHLRRAMDDMKRGAQETKRTLVRSLDDDNGYALVTEIDPRHAKYKVEFAAWIDDNKSLCVEGASHNEEQDLRRAFAKQQATFSSDDISVWLVKQLHRLQTVSLRDRGGIYFIPRTSFEEWDKICEVVHDATAHQIFEIPAMEGDKTVAAILDALTREAEAMTAQMESFLIPEDDKKKPGKRALNTRLSQLDSMKEKLATYADSLGVQTNNIESSLKDAKALVTLAVLELDRKDETQAA